MWMIEPPTIALRAHPAGGADRAVQQRPKADFDGLWRDGADACHPHRRDRWHPQGRDGLLPGPVVLAIFGELVAAWTGVGAVLADADPELP